jgi:hypothetical protein
VVDLVIQRRRSPAQLQPVQRALARHRRAVLASRCKLACQNRKQRIVPKMVMVVEVLVTQRQSKHSLPHQRADLVLDQRRRSPIHKAAREPLDQADRPIRHPQQQAAAIRRNRPAVERRHHTPLFNRCKAKQIRNTLCRHRSSFFSS